MKKRRLGEILVSAGVLTPSQLKTALGYQQSYGGRLAECLCSLGLVSEPVLLSTLSRHIGIPAMKVGDLKVPEQVLELVPRALMVRHRVLPVEARPGKPRPKLVVAMAEPQNVQLIDELAFASGYSVVPALALASDLDRAFRTNAIYGLKDLARELDLEDGGEDEFIVVRDGAGLF